MYKEAVDAGFVPKEAKPGWFVVAKDVFVHLILCEEGSNLPKTYFPKGKRRKRRSKKRQELAKKDSNHFTTMFAFHLSFYPPQKRRPSVRAILSVRSHNLEKVCGVSKPNLRHMLYVMRG